jgi:energy-coupling factor transporter transmembrane protein EcfT
VSRTYLAGHLIAGAGFLLLNVAKYTKLGINVVYISVGVMVLGWSIVLFRSYSGREDARPHIERSESHAAMKALQNSSRRVSWRAVATRTFSLITLLALVIAMFTERRLLALSVALIASLTALFVHASQQNH